MFVLLALGTGAPASLGGACEPSASSTNKCLRGNGEQSSTFFCETPGATQPSCADPHLSVRRLAKQELLAQIYSAWLITVPYRGHQDLRPKGHWAPPRISMARNSTTETAPRSVGFLPSSAGRTDSMISGPRPPWHPKTALQPLPSGPSDPPHHTVLHLLWHLKLGSFYFTFFLSFHSQLNFSLLLKLNGPVFSLLFRLFNTNMLFNFNFHYFQKGREPCELVTIVSFWAFFL